MFHGDEARVLSCLPGRCRVHLPGWHGAPADLIEARLRQVHGVRQAQANPLTGNVLVHFDPKQTSPELLLKVLQRPPKANPPANPDLARPDGTTALPGSVLLRVGVRGLLGHAVVDALWFGGGFLGQSLGFPFLASLGPLHVLLDIAVWGTALASARQETPDRHAADSPRSQADRRRNPSSIETAGA